MFIENNAIIITVVLITVCMLSYIPSLVREIELSNRKKISYYNYVNVKNRFDYKPRKIILFAFICCLVALVVFTILFSISNVTRIFDLVFIPFIIITLFMILVELRISNTNKDLSVFNNLYSNVNESERSKESTISLLEKNREIYSKLLIESNDVINSFNSCTNLKMDFTSVYSLLSKFDLRIKNISDSLDNYDKAIITDFDNSLQDYIYNNNISSNNVSHFEKPNELEFDLLVNQIHNELASQGSTNTKEALNTNVISSANLLLTILDINKQLNNDFNTFMIELLLYVNNLKDKSIVISYLVSNELISIDIIINIINVSDYDWFYSIKLSNIFVKYLDSIVGSIISCNAIKSAYAFLNNNSNLISKIESLIKKTTVNNDTYDIFKVYLSLYLTNSSFNSDSNKYENMTYSLLDYYSKTLDKNMLSKINSIITDASYMQNAKLIESSYIEALSVVNDYSNNYLNVLVSYGKSSCKDYKYIDYDKVLNLFQEYKSSLNLNGIHNLVLILEGILLIEEVDSNIINSVLTNVDKDLVAKKHIDTGRNIINYLNKNVHNDFIRILYRIEKVRLSYDMIIRL